MYHPGQVWSILLDDAQGEGDIDERIDVARGMHKLKHEQRVFLQALSHGYTAEYAMHSAGVEGNSTRYKRDVLRKLTEILNGGEGNGTKDCADE